jgi:hypothetical protein
MVVTVHYYLLFLCFYALTAPPTFSESIFGPQSVQDAEDSQYTQGNLNYVPRYPVYNFVSK